MQKGLLMLAWAIGTMSVYGQVNYTVFGAGGSVAPDGTLFVIGQPITDRVTEPALSAHLGAVPCWVAVQFPTIATFTCLTGTQQWTNTACWSGLVSGDPYPNRGVRQYGAIIPAGSGDHIVIVDAPDTNGIMMDGQLDLQGNQTKLRIPAGESIQLFGAVTLRGELEVLGGSLVAHLSGAADANQADLRATTTAGSPGLIRLPITTYTDVPGSASRTISSSGAGSRIELPNLSAIFGDPIITASGGGVVDMPLLTAYEPATIRATGAGSIVQIPQFSTLLSGRTLAAVNGGRIETAPLTQVAGELNIDGATSFIDVSQIAGIDGARIQVQGGAQATLPLPTSYNGDSTTDFLVATGANSLLTLPALATVMGDGLRLEAANGGRVELPALTSVTGTDFVVLVAGSRIDAPGLIGMPDCSIHINNGALIGAPFLDLSGVRSIEIAGPDFIFETAYVTTIDRSTVLVSSGAIVSFPQVTGYSTWTTTGFARLRANGPGSRLELNNLTTLNSLGSAQLELIADGNGGRVEARNLQTLTGDPIRLIAHGTNSVVDVGEVDFPAIGNIEVDTGGRLIVRGNLRFAFTDPARFEFSSPATLEMDGGQQGECVEMEVAGADLGNVPNGWTSNFQLDRLVIGAGATVRLVDLIDNGNRNGSGGPAEALYISTLEFADAESRLILNGISIYYGQLVGSNGIVGGRWCCDGDSNGDNMINLLDLTRLLAAFGTCRGGSNFLVEADFNGNGCIDIGDLSFQLTNYGTACP